MSSAVNDPRPLRRSSMLRPYAPFLGGLLVTNRDKGLRDSFMRSLGAQSGMIHYTELNS